MPSLINNLTKYIENKFTVMTVKWMKKHLSPLLITLSRSVRIQCLIIFVVSFFCLSKQKIGCSLSWLVSEDCISEFSDRPNNYFQYSIKSNHICAIRMLFMYVYNCTSLWGILLCEQGKFHARQRCSKGHIPALRNISGIVCLKQV